MSKKLEKDHEILRAKVACSKRCDGGIVTAVSRPQILPKSRASHAHARRKFETIVTVRKKIKGKHKSLT